ncbi:MAG: hypothetical protein HN919_00485, partial [Verrucomicrobia bacterium]|nr:hypothetical protein [Verrucomicrobiota bacterium]
MKMRVALYVLLAVALATQAPGAAPLGALEKDWLLQANGKPTLKHVRDEIAWTRELAARLQAMAVAPDLSAELEQLSALEVKLGEGDAAALSMQHYLSVRRVKRTIMFKNPAVDFSEVLLVDNPYPPHRHESGHRHGYRGFPGNTKGRLLVLEGLSPDSPV